MSIPDPVPEGMEKSAGVFVSLKKDEQLRGCIGTFEPIRENIASEIIHNAVAAGAEDPRFWPVELDELSEIDISVDVLTPSEQVDSKDDLDPKRYGIIVKSGRRTGLLLPDLEGVNTADEQISIACQKAGISPGDEVELYRFEVIRYE
jgi:AmmeMemoRadiSam system protein A